jgi:hypothetical protein
LEPLEDRCLLSARAIVGYYAPNDEYRQVNNIHNTSANDSPATADAMAGTTPGLLAGVAPLPAPQSPPPPTPTPTPPTLLQALLALYLDGAYLELTTLNLQFSRNEIQALDEPFAPVSGSTDPHVEAKAAGFDYDKVVGLEYATAFLRSGMAFFYSPADIQLNLPYTGPLGLFAVAAGEQAAIQATQLQPTSSSGSSHAHHK